MTPGHTIVDAPDENAGQPPAHLAGAHYTIPSRRISVPLTAPTTPRAAVPKLATSLDQLPASVTAGQAGAPATLSPTSAAEAAGASPATLGPAARAVLLSAVLSLGAVAGVAGITTQGMAGNVLASVDALPDAARSPAPAIAIAAMPPPGMVAATAPPLTASLAPPLQDAAATLAVTMPPADPATAPAVAPVVQPGATSGGPMKAFVAIGSDGGAAAPDAADTTPYGSFSATSPGTSLFSSGSNPAAASGAAAGPAAAPGSPALSLPSAAGRVYAAASVPSAAQSATQSAAEPAAATAAPATTGTTTTGTTTTGTTTTGNGPAGSVADVVGSGPGATDTGGGNIVTTTLIPPNSILDNGQTVSLPEPGGGGSTGSGSTGTGSTGNGSTGNGGGSGSGSGGTTASPIGDPVAVPEPASLLLLLAASACSLVVRRRALVHALPTALPPSLA